MNISVKCRANNFERWAFAIIDDDNCWAHGLKFYMAVPNANDVCIMSSRDIRYYMRRFRRASGFDKTVCFAGNTGTDVFSLPTKYLEYNIQSALNMAIAPQIFTDGMWIQNTTQSMAICEMLGHLNIPRRMRKNPSPPITLMIDNKNYAGIGAKIVRSMNDAKLLGRVNVCRDEKRYVIPDGYLNEDDANIFVMGSDAKPKLIFNFRADKTVCFESFRGNLIGCIPYTMKNGRCKQLLDIKLEMMLKMISDFKRRII